MASEDFVKEIQQAQKRLERKLVDSSTNNPIIRPGIHRAREAESKLDRIEEGKDLLIELGGELSPGEFRMVRYLWNRGSAPKDQIFLDCWDEPTSESNQDRTITRLRTILNELNRGVIVTTKNKIVTLERPDK